MSPAKAKRPARRQRPAAAVRKAAPVITPEQHQAFLQAALFDGCMGIMRSLRARLQAGVCPATITEPERRAAVIDLDRALAQLDNLSHHYWKGGA